MRHYKYSYNCPTFVTSFTFSDIRKINKVLKAIEKYAEYDGFYANAIKELETATDSEKIAMFKHLLNIFNSVDGDSVNLEQAVFLASYE
jgi:hypothetical protein